MKKGSADYHALAESWGYKWIGGRLPANTMIKTLWLCSVGHEREASYNSILMGKGCPYCYGNAPKKPEDYCAVAKGRGFIWLGPEVPTTKINTWWECEEGHQWKARYSAIRRGRGCPHCSNRVPKTIEDYHALASEWVGRDYHAPTIEWIGEELPPTTMTKTRWRCSRGHKWGTSYNSIQQGTGCPHCCNEWRSGVTKAYWELGIYDTPECRRKFSETKKAAWAQGVYDTDDYRQKISRVRKEARARGVYDGVFQSPTSIEIAVSNALDELNIEHCSQYRPESYSRIYDEFVPPNILVEVQGDYWHSREEIKRRDVEKAAWAKENNYHLVIIWEYEIKEWGALALICKRISPLLQSEKACGLA